MNSLAFVTHPSVRIKGTENNYNPSLCLDERCPIKAPHMHCPFCVKTDAYQDPVILKAHYRVKHVDKGIEFAGLKILRCCDHCDIIGIIKGEKRFKGAHWHCYRCRNGFNRRDEAVKHYKTHFRNPQTTFQIQITQDLNLPTGSKSANHSHHESINSQNYTTSVESPLQEMIHPVLAQTPLTEQNVISGNGSLPSNKYKSVKVKEEPLLPEEDPGAVNQGQTIMIIQGDSLESAFADHIIHSGGEVSVLDKNSIDSNLSWEIRCRMEEEEKNEYKARMEEYKNQVDVLQQRVQELESSHQPGQLRVQDLLASLSLGSQDKQLLAQQISKYLEEELQHSPEADTLSHPEPPQPPLVGTSDSEAIIRELNSTESAEESLSSVVRTSLAQDLQSSSVVAHLGPMAEPYQVIASDTNNHRIIINHTVDNNSLLQNESDQQQEGGKTSEDSQVPASRDSQSLFVPVTSVTNDQEIIVAQVMPSGVPSDTIPQNFLVSADSGISQGEQSVINLDGVSEAENRLLQVVATSSAADGQGSETFIVETNDGERIILQGPEDKSESANTKTDEKAGEPETKRPRIS